MRVRTALFVGALLVALFALPAGGALSADSTHSYIVQMLDQPAVAYSGGVSGLPATKPGKGKKIDPSSDNVKKYRGYLKDKHDKALGSVGGSSTVYDYSVSFNGFAATLSESQAAALMLQKGVVAVTPDELQTIDTFSTPSFLGLNAKGGLWDQLGGVSKGGLNKGAGEDIIIGDIDSGIWPENLAFSDRKVDGSNGNLYPHKVTGFSGTCQTGEEFDASDCNKKLIGARYFNAAWGGNAGIDAQRPWEFDSPRDFNSHGSHTASTAGGNFGVQPTGDAAFLPAISGMAPRARLSVYKALWSTQDGSTASGFTSDLVSAIDTAVADGVDVINYSISGSLTNFLDPVEVSFLFAADAGVFVSAAAGNEGPGASTVNHPSPWITTVAAGTHDRTSTGSVTIDGVKYDGAAYSNAATGQLIDGQNAGLTPAPNDAARQCFAKEDNGGTPALDPAKVTGKIVLCDRGVNALVNKGRAVKEAGGIGMVLANVASSGAPLAILHRVPAVHVPYTLANYTALHAAAAAGKTASIAKSTLVFGVPAPTTAGFSSRGPLLAGAGDLLKPDVMAPGVDILAAVAPPGDGGRDFDLFQGTSMATPHVAGVAALLKQLHPNWTPMMVKSALMTSGIDVVGVSNTSPATIFSQGAGHIRPNSAADPGLVFDSGFNDWLAFLCGTTTGIGASTCNALQGLGYSLDPSDFNVASIAIGSLPGSQTVTRKVTNVGKSSATYTPSVAGMVGVTVAVNPSSLTLAPGQTGSFTVKFTTSTAPLNAYVGGQLTWTQTGGPHAVRIPLVVRPVAIGAPLEVSGSPTGISYSVTPGFAGTLSFAARGLDEADVTTTTIEQDPDQTFNPNDATGTFSKTFALPAGLSLFRAGVDEAFITPTGTDLDVYVFRNGAFVAQSADGDSNEMVTIANPPAGNYTVFVHGFSTNGPSANVSVFEWEVPTTSAGNMTVPGATPVAIGTSVPVNLGFSGLTSGKWYLGQVVYGNPGTIGSTIVSVR